MTFRLGLRASPPSAFTKPQRVGLLYLEASPLGTTSSVQAFHRTLPADCITDQQRASSFALASATVGVEVSRTHQPLLAALGGL